MEPTAASKKPTIHIVLARSYLAYFVFSLLGLFADTFIGFTTPSEYGNWIAIGCFVIGSLLIWWAQATSSAVSEHPYFERGPYRYMRNPTHIGIMLLVAGYTAVSGSVVFLLVTLVGYLISNKFFKKYESLLHDEYGAEYKNYKKEVPKIF
jgi:protein-S-isoprenylcysteine O-methyltransferase Ste14